MNSGTTLLFSACALFASIAAINVIVFKMKLDLNKYAKENDISDDYYYPGKVLKIIEAHEKHFKSTIIYKSMIFALGAICAVSIFLTFNAMEEVGRSVAPTSNSTNRIQSK
jgi:hypothetical protein